MKIVKLTFNYDWPIFRQTPNYSQVWGNYKFVIDEELKECDFWIVYSDYNLKPEKVKCNPENIIFIIGEGYHTSPKFGQKFLDQFGLIITVQKEITHRNIKLIQNALPWFVGKSYDDLNSYNIPKKTKLISVIASNKILTEGHQKRFDFVKQLKKHFGEKLDVFGRGINEVNDKWDALVDYKYSIAIENDLCDFYVTEKYFDCLYANTLQFYYGCPNLESFVESKSFIRIDIDDVKLSIDIIENAINNNEYENRKKLLQEEKIKSINRDQFFPFIAKIMDGMDFNLDKEIIILNPDSYSQYLTKSQVLYRKIKNKIKGFL